MIKKWGTFNENVGTITYEIVQEVIYFCYFVYEGQFENSRDHIRMCHKLLDTIDKSWEIFYEIGYKETNELIATTLKKSNDPILSKLIMVIYEISKEVLPNKPPISEIENELIVLIDNGFSFWLDTTEDRKRFIVKLHKPQKTTIDDYLKYLNRAKSIIHRLKSIGCQNPVLTETDFKEFEDGRTSVTITFKL